VHYTSKAPSHFREGFLKQKTGKNELRFNPFLAPGLKQGQKTKKALPSVMRQVPDLYMVAGGGFEPPTFGL
jgi:hypothetical protein